MTDQPGAAGIQRYDEMSFEELVLLLEKLTDRLASNDVGIEEAADLYEQAERLHALASERLARVQARIERLGASTAAGSPIPANGGS